MLDLNRVKTQAEGRVYALSHGSLSLSQRDLLAIESNIGQCSQSTISGGKDVKRLSGP